MYNYKIYGLHIETDFKFIQLAEESKELATEENTVTIVEAEQPEAYRTEENGFYFIDEKKSYFVNTYMYMYIEDGKMLTYEKKPELTDDLLNSYIIGWGLSMLGIQRQMLSIHCACLADNDGAVILSGFSGSGKSTIATQLLTRGYRLVADDMTLVDAVSSECAYAYPAFPYNKLCRDAAIAQGYNIDELIQIDEERDKFFVPYEKGFSAEKVRVKAVVMLTLTDKDELFAEEILGVKKMYAIMDTLFLAGIQKDKTIGSKIGQMCLKLASKVRVFHVSRPIDRNTTQEVLETVINMSDAC